MKNILYVAALAFIGCTPKNETAKTTVVANTFILDSLLRYDSEVELGTRFGTENIMRDTAYYPEGMGTYMVTLLYPGSNNQVEFTWKDTIDFKILQSFTVTYDSSDWRMASGVEVGSRLEDIIRINGKDFTFSGFGWDYGGTAVFGGEGQLKNIALIFDTGSYELSEVEMDSLLGDRSISSVSPLARKVNPIVAQIIVSKN